MPAGVRVSGPWSRRRVLAGIGGLAGAAGVVVLAARRAERGASSTAGEPEVAGAAPHATSRVSDVGAPLRAAPPRALQVAVFTGGRDDAVDGVFVDAVPIEALRRSVAELDAEGQAQQGQAKVRVDVLDVGLPSATPGPLAPLGGVVQALALAPFLGSGAPPDLVFYTGQPTVGPAVQRELVAARQLGGARPLDGSLRGEAAFAPADYLPAALDVCRHDGQLYALPVLAMPTLLLYGHPMFHARPDLRPTAQWDWADVTAAAERLTRRAAPGAPPGTPPEEYGLFLTGPPGGLLSLIWQHGGEVIETAPDGRRRAALDRPAAREAVAFYAALHRGGGGGGGGGAGVALPGGVPAVGEPVAVGIGGAFAYSSEGMSVGGARVAMMYDAPWQVSAFPEFDWLGYAPLPGGRYRVGALGVRASLAVPAGASFPEASTALAARLAKRLLGRVAMPAGPQPPSALTDALLAARRLNPRAPAPTTEAQEALRERGRLLAEALGAARSLTLGHMDRTAQLFSVLATLATALQRPTVPIDQAVVSAQRALEELLR